MKYASILDNLGRNTVRNIIALFWCGFSALYLWMVTFHNIPKDNIRVVDTILGFMLGTLIATLMGYYFGSTKGSQEKTEMLANSTPLPTSSKSTILTETKTDELPK